MLDATSVVERLWDAMRSRDWDRVEDVIAPHAVIEWPHTGERFASRDAYVAVNRGYPEDWDIALKRVIGDQDRVAALIVVDQDGHALHCCAFYDLFDGRIVSGVEYWVTAGAVELAPPQQTLV